MTPQRSIHPVLTVAEARQTVHVDRQKPYVVVRADQAHLFSYPGFYALQSPALIDAVMFKHSGRERRVMEQMGWV